MRNSDSAFLSSFGTPIPSSPPCPVLTLDLPELNGGAHLEVQAGGGEVAPVEQEGDAERERKDPVPPGRTPVERVEEVVPVVRAGLDLAVYEDFAGLDQDLRLPPAPHEVRRLERLAEAALPGTGAVPPPAAWDLRVYAMAPKVLAWLADAPSTRAAAAKRGLNANVMMWVPGL